MPSIFALLPKSPSFYLLISLLLSACNTIPFIGSEPTGSGTAADQSANETLSNSASDERVESIDTEERLVTERPDQNLIAEDLVDTEVDSIDRSDEKLAADSTTISQTKTASAANDIVAENDLESEAELPPAGDLWERVRLGFNFPDTVDDHPKAQPLIKRYRERLMRSPTLVNRVNKNAAAYLYFVVGELEKNKVPLEIALLPIVESRYDPFAYSPGRASGMWQFIPGTGKRFGLTQDWWHDERRDTIAATGAAIQYLLYLHKRFDNDWLKAMAAYNAGQGNVAKAIRKNKKRNKPIDYWSLDLPKETQHYIPKLLAWRDIILNPQQYQVALPPIADQPYFSIVDVGSQIDLAEAASLAEIDIETVYQLNPAYNRWATDPGAPHELLVPYSQAEVFRNNLAELPHDQRMTWRRYIIKRNDSLIKIAKQFNTTPSLIAKVNGLNSNRIREGKALLIPSASKESEYYSKSVEQRLAKRQQRAPGKNKQRIQHKVRSGESLWDISRHYGVSVKALARWNQMAPGDVLSANRTLVVWTNKKVAYTPKNETRKLYYKVRSGDSLAFIASKFKVRIKDIENWNNDIAAQKYIQPGQLLTLYVALTDRQLLAN